MGDGAGVPSVRGRLVVAGERYTIEDERCQGRMVPGTFWHFLAFCFCGGRAG
jgi:hypothetical protein